MTLQRSKFLKIRLKDDLEFKKHIADPRYKNYKVISIALDCGFNSKSSFNRIFKNFEQCTPTEYMNNCK